MTFLRRDTDRYIRLGKKSRKKQKWRRPKGRHNKMRERRAGYPPRVSIGYKQDNETRNKINGNVITKVNNLKDLKKIKGLALLGRMGKKKKIEIAKMAGKIKFVNFNPAKFLRINK